MTQEELRNKILNDAKATAMRVDSEQTSSKIGAPKPISGLGTGVYSPIPLGQSFTGINPAEKTGYIPFGGNGATTVGLAGTTTSYPSRIDITGRSNGVNATSLIPTSVPSVGLQNPMLATNPKINPESNPMGYTPFTPLSQRMAPLPSGLPLAQSMQIEGGPMSLTRGAAMTSPQTAEQQGRIPMATPYGTMYATEQQASNAMTPRTFAQQGSRTPEQQQALLAQVRQNGQNIASDYLKTMATFAQDRRENTPTYTTFSGASIKAPTNMFGQPIASWAKIYEKSSAANEAAIAGIRGKGETNRGGIALAPVGGPQPAKAAQPQRATPSTAPTFPTAPNAFGSPFPPMGQTQFPLAGASSFPLIGQPQFPLAGSFPVF